MQTDYITISLGLQEFSVINVEERENEIEIEVVRKWNYAVCPRCSHTSNRIHQKNGALRRVQDLPIRDKKVILAIHKRRFICPCCGKVFTETLDSVERKRRRTIRYEKYLYEKWKNRSIKDLSLFEGIPYSTSRSIWYRIAKKEISACSHPVPRKMGIDEFSVSRGHKCNTVITDLERHRVVEVLEGRKKETVKTYLEGLLPKPEVFVIDMYTGYASAIKEACPEADIVIDKFHVLRKINEALDIARKTLQGVYEKCCRGKKVIYRIRYLLLKAKENLSKDERKRLDSVFNKAPLLAEAYNLKELFRDLYKVCENYENGRRCIEYWCDMAEVVTFRKLAKTIRRWIHPLSLYFKHRITNGYTEGINNKIKVDKRLAYGYRNFENQRLRILSKCA